jgi:nucleotide-binding universal stress UspA family protein
MDDSIVVGTDGSDTAKQAVSEAVRLAKALGAPVHVVAAFEPTRGAHVTGAPEGAAKAWAPYRTTWWSQFSPRPRPPCGWPAPR